MVTPGGSFYEKVRSKGSFVTSGASSLFQGAHYFRKFVISRGSLDREVLRYIRKLVISEAR